MANRIKGLYDRATFAKHLGMVHAHVALETQWISMVTGWFAGCFRVLEARKRHGKWQLRQPSALFKRWKSI